MGVTADNSGSATAWHCSEAPEAVTSARAIAQLMLKRFPSIGSVADVGCSIGTFLNAFMKEGVTTIQGFDAHWVDQERLVIPPESFRTVDLAKGLGPVEKRYDLLISLEVAEHLPVENASDFVRDLTERSDLILFSAAVPGQGGVGHVNEQWQSYWRDLFAERGYIPYDFVRNEIWNNADVPFWYKQNILLYSATPLDVPPAGEMVDVVHPEQYLGTHYKDVAPGMYFNRKLRRLLARFGVGEES